MARKPLVLVKQEDTGCIIPISHKLNQDGYFRKRISNNEIKMYHVYIWEKEKGEVPNGYEIHHKCGNRACCNIEHLECIEGSLHTSLGNTERYKERYEKACAYWRKTNCTGSFLGEKFNVSFSTGCKWIREWKAKGVETIPNGSRTLGETPNQSEKRGME